MKLQTSNSRFIYGLHPQNQVNPCSMKGSGKVAVRIRVVTASGALREMDVRRRLGWEISIRYCGWGEGEGGGAGR